jgi:hypothetical protein
MTGAQCKLFASFLRGTEIARDKVFQAYLAIMAVIGNKLVADNTWTVTGSATMPVAVIADELDALGDQIDTGVPVHFHNAADVEASIKHHEKLAIVSKQQQHIDHNTEEVKRLQKLRVPTGSVQIKPDLAPNVARLCEGLLSGTLHGTLPAKE